MSRAPKPYIKCEKMFGTYRLTVMKSNGRSLLLGGRSSAPVGDMAALRESVIALVTNVRAAEQKVGIQADGHS